MNLIDDWMFSFHLIDTQDFLIEGREAMDLLCLHLGHEKWEGILMDKIRTTTKKLGLGILIEEEEEENYLPVYSPICKI
jgi:hypothetical protein